MKKTLFALALMAAFGSQVMAEEPPTWDFSTTIYGTRYNKAYVKGIAFCLATDSDRYTATAPLYRADFDASLVSIQILARENNDNEIPTTLALMVVDSEGALIGLSSSHTHTPGMLNGFQYTRMISTFSFDTETAPVTLNTSENYYAYFVSNDVAETLTSDFVLTADNFNSTVSQVGVALHDGTTYTDDVMHWGTLTGLGTSSLTAYVPDMTITLKAPEPATATLSLLALAGLAARRRR